MGFRTEDLTLDNLTVSGWILTLLTLGIVVVLMIFSGTLWSGILPSGQYPAIVLAAPGLVIGVAFFAASAVALEAVGLPAFKRS